MKKEPYYHSSSINLLFRAVQILVLVVAALSIYVVVQ